MSTHSVSKRFLWRCAVWTVILLLGLFVYRAGSALYHNYQLRDQFVAAASASPYQQGVPLEKMDLTAYASYFPQTFAPLDYSLTYRIETPVTLKYYADIPTGETAVALEIAEGTTIVAIPEETTGSAFQEAGYGYTSYPAYERGWRYVRPFLTTEGVDHQRHESYYYVKMDSLEAVLDKVINVNESFQAAIRQQGWTLHKGTHVIARSIDNALYHHGAYLSPDLFDRVIDRWNVVLLVVATGMLIAVVLLRRGARPKYRGA